MVVDQSVKDCTSKDGDCQEILQQSKDDRLETD
jgi:hypothetical protein